MFFFFHDCGFNFGTTFLLDFLNNFATWIAECAFLLHCGCSYLCVVVTLSCCCGILRYSERCVVACFLFFHWYSEGRVIASFVVVTFSCCCSILRYSERRVVASFFFFIGSPRGVSLLFPFFPNNTVVVITFVLLLRFRVDVASYSTPRCVSLLFFLFFHRDMPELQYRV